MLTDGCLCCRVNPLSLVEILLHVVRQMTGEWLPLAAPGPGGSCFRGLGTCGMELPCVLIENTRF